MYTSFQLALKYLHYYRTAANGKGHGIHSPFVFDFITNVLNGGEMYPVPGAVEALRQTMLHDRRPVEIVDLGAGSRIRPSRTKTVRQLAKTAVKPRKYTRLLYRLVKHYRPANIMELGTSLGVTTSALALANPSASVVTIEGSPQIFKIAVENFQRLRLPNIRPVPGNFNDLLPGLLLQWQRVDLCYIDGNHRLEPTMNYFHQLLSRVHNDTILVFDDIHWSPGMEQAWQAIKNHPSVRCTIDLFFLGFVFFRDELKVKRHFVIRY